MAPEWRVLDDPVSRRLFAAFGAACRCAGPQRARMSDMERWLRERKVTEVECLVADLNGIARGKILPAAKFIRSLREDTLRLPESDLHPDRDRRLCGRGTGDRPGGARHAHAAGSALAAPRALVRGADRAGDLRLLSPRRQRGDDRAAPGAAPRAGRLRRARLAAGGGARARVLPDQDQRGSGLSARAADRPLAAARRPRARATASTPSTSSIRSSRTSTTGARRRRSTSTR